MNRSFSTKILGLFLLMFLSDVALCQQGGTYDYNALVNSGRAKTKEGHVCWWISFWGRANEKTEDQMYRLVTNRVSCGAGRDFTDILMTGKIRCVKADGLWFDTPTSCPLNKDGTPKSASACADDQASAVYTKEEFAKYLGSIEQLALHKKEVLERIHQNE